MDRVINGFDRLTDAELELLANAIVSSMTNNTAFPTPSPTLVVVKDGIEDYHIALVAAQSGDKAEVAAKNTRKAALITLLRELGAYVNFAAKGDRELLVSSGFRVTRAAQPAPPVTKPVIEVLLDGLNAGELLMKFKKVAGARSYQFECTPEPVLPTSVWQVQTATVSKKLFSGLESGKRYSCRVAAVGNNNQLMYSDPVSRVTQ